VDDEYFRLLTVIVVAILTVSLLINALLASDPASVRGPPVRIHGYFEADGRPAAGYYTTAPGALPSAMAPSASLSLTVAPVR
jgi:hypothetical protein